MHGIYLIGLAAPPLVSRCQLSLRRVPDIAADALGIAGYASTRPS